MPFIPIFLCACCFGAGVLTPTVWRIVRGKLQRVGEDKAITAPIDTLQYARKIGQFALFAPRGEIVFLGDSRIEVADWNEVLETSGITNRGISGDTTTGVVQRLAVSLRGTVKLCIVQAGVNDVWRGVSREVIERNFEEIIRYVADEKRAELVVTAVVLVDAERAALNAEIAQLNASLSQLCRQSAVHWLDLNETLAPAGYLEPRFTDDGTHFTGEGYCAIAEPLRQLISASARS